MARLCASTPGGIKKMQAYIALVTRCITDSGELVLAPVSEREDEDIISWVLKCNSCGCQFAVRHGVPCVIDSDSEEENLTQFATQWSWFYEGKSCNPGEV